MFLSWREMRYSKGRYLLIGGMMMLIAWLVYMISGFAQGLAFDSSSAVRNMPADVYYLKHDTEKQLEKSRFTPDEMETFMDEYATNNMSPLGTKMDSVHRGNEGKNAGVALFGIQADSDFAPEVSEGDTLTEGKGVVVDRSMKDDGVEIGDTLEQEDGSYDLTVTGFTKQSYSYNHAPVIFMGFDQWETLEEDPHYNAILAESNAADSIDTPSDMEKVTSEQIIENMPGFSAEQASFNFTNGFLLLITAFMLAVFFYIMTMQKMDQYGVLKAIGTTTGYLVKTLIAQTVVLSLISIAFGAIVSGAISLFLPDSVPFALPFQTIMLDGLLILGAALLGSLISLIQIAKVDPIEAIGGAD